MSIMRGRVFEKVGVNISTVHGAFSQEFAQTDPGRRRRPALLGRRHLAGRPMRNPHVPAVHMNTRHIVTTQSLVRRRRRPDADVAGRRGRRTTSTPRCKPPATATKRHYPRFKAWCDEYFFLPHRNEPRGVGGIFYDYLDSGDWEADFAFTRDVGLAFLDVYPRIVRRHMDETLERGRPPAPAGPPRPLRRIQPALRPRHAIRPQDRRKYRGNPDVLAAGGALALMPAPSAAIACCILSALERDP